MRSETIYRIKATMTVVALAAIVVGLLALLPSPNNADAPTTERPATADTVNCRNILVGAKVKVPIKHCN